MTARESATHETTPSPVVIGGIGGSGTRVLYEIVQALGWNLGAPDLNNEKDYTGFTVLFKDTLWLSPQCEQRNQQALKLIEAALRGSPRMGLRNLLLAGRAAIRMALRGHNHLGAGRGLWALMRGVRLFLGAPKVRLPAVPWGWKEPNSHVFLPQIAEAFPNVRYIHLLRHGVDMAFSENQQQLMKWGPHFGVDAHTDMATQPASSLDFWLAANKRAFETGERLGPQGFLSIRFEDLCAAPRAEITRLAAFLGTSVDESLMARLESIPQTPSSTGRHKNHDLSQFTEDALEGVRSYGFEVAP